MGRYIVKFRGHYMEWSTNCGGPISFGYGRDEFIDWYVSQYGPGCIKDLLESLRRVDQCGSSSWQYSCSYLVENNTAGHSKSRLTADEIYQIFCVEKGGKYNEDSFWQDKIAAQAGLGTPGLHLYS